MFFSILFFTHPICLSDSYDMKSQYLNDVLLETEQSDLLANDEQKPDVLQWHTGPWCYKAGLPALFLEGGRCSQYFEQSFNSFTNSPNR